MRNDMYLVSEAIRVLGKDKASELSAEEKTTQRIPIDAAPPTRPPRIASLSQTHRRLRLALAGSGC